MQGTFVYKYPHPGVAVDNVVLGYADGRLSLLLIQRANDPYKGMWAMPGGFMEMEEDAAQGAIRELQEETGLTDVRVHQLHTFTAPDRDDRERVISIAHWGITHQREVKGQDDARQARWWSLDSLPPLAFDHYEMLRATLARLHELVALQRLSALLAESGFTADEQDSIIGIINTL